jgi:hypothetical protein
MNRDYDLDLLDDRIDRVARELTRVSPDFTFNAKLDDRLVPTSNAGPTFSIRALATVSVAIAIVMLTSMWWRPTQMTRTDDQAVVPPALEGRALAAVSPLPLSVARMSVTRRTPEPTMPPGRVATVLDVAPLAIVALDVDTLADLEPLHVDDVRVVEIATREMREYR